MEADHLSSPEDSPPETAGFSFPTREGEVWMLGRHGLLVGDGLDPSALAVATTFAGDVPDTIFFDPPYELAEAWNYRPAFPKAVICCDPTRIVKASSMVASMQFHHEVVWYGGPKAFYNDRPTSVHRSLIVATEQKRVWIQWKAKIPKEKMRKDGLDSPWQGLSSHYVSTQKAEGHKHEKSFHLLRAVLTGLESVWVYDPFAGSGVLFLAAPPETSVFGVELDPVQASKILTRYHLQTGVCPEKMG